MQDKFNFYDFVSYIIPGAINVLLVYWLLEGCFGISVPIKFESIGDSIIFLLLSYLLGHISLVSLEKVIKPPIIKSRGDLFSVQYLSKNTEEGKKSQTGKKYTDNFQKAIKDAACDVWNISEKGSEEENKVVRQQIFDLCYKLIIQEKIASHTEIFNGLYHFYFNVLLTLWISMTISILIFLKTIIFLFLSCVWSCCVYNVFNEENYFNIVISIILILCFIFLKNPLEDKYKTFAENFVDSVYVNFLTWYKKKYFLNKIKSGDDHKN